MVFVAVSKYDTAKFIPILLNIGKIRYNNINAKHFAVGERQSAVDYEHIVAALDYGEILADLVQTAQRDYLDGGAALFTRFLISALIFCAVRRHKISVICQVIAFLPILTVALRLFAALTALYGCAKHAQRRKLLLRFVCTYQFIERIALISALFG